MAKKKVTVPKYDRYLTEARQALASKPRHLRYGEVYMQTLEVFDPKTFALVLPRHEGEAAQYDDVIPALLDFLSSQWKGQ